MATALVLMDQLIRGYVEDNMTEGEKRPLVRETVELRKHHNKGFVMNTCADRPEFVKMLSAMSAGCAIGTLALAVLKGSNRVRKMGLALVTAGGLSNLYDRFARGYVVDYLGVKKGPEKLQKITFNLADVMIAAGSVLALCPGKARKGKTVLRKR